ncbi:MAG: hypothetical protein HOJ21_17260 [Alphaproteobacteria bacterium]|jgi:hypothetical protein|nr:hypothetical protein [Alphaproteobacteria bacterium]
MASYSSTPSFYSSEFLSSPAPSEGFIFTTDTQTDGLGSSIATGDIDGDGLEDIVLAATTNTKETGEVYVILSSANPTFGALNNLDDMVTAGTAVKIIGDVLQSSTDGVLAAGNNGVAVGDFNGDGLDDLLIGNGTEIASGAHVIFGGEITAGGTISTADLDGSNGFSITRGQAEDQLGASVAAGDFNGDGFDDILIGAREYDVGGNSSSGAVHIINGGVSLNVIGPDFALSTMDGSEGAKFFGGDQVDTKGLGSHVANVGDVDGDGVDDFGMTTTLGQTTILYGKNPAFNEASFEIGETPLAGVAVSEGRTVSPAFSGTEFLGGIVAAAGDVNGDGFGDFTVSVPREASIAENNLIGVTHLIFGAPRGFGNLTTPLTDPSLAITFDASNRNGLFQEGFAIGDINGDGFDDWSIMGDASNGARADIIFGVQT